MTREQESVLALYPTVRGLGFAYFRKPGGLFDWGANIVRARSAERNAGVLGRIEGLLERYTPDTVVTEEYGEPEVRRSNRILRLYKGIMHAAQARSVPCCKVRRQAIRAAFAATGAMTRHEVALAVIREFPVLATRLPDKRKAWDPENPAMGLFSATALGLAYYASNRS